MERISSFSDVAYANSCASPRDRFAQARRMSAESSCRSHEVRLTLLLMFAAMVPYTVRSEAPKNYELPLQPWINAGGDSVPSITFNRQSENIQRTLDQIAPSPSDNNLTSASKSYSLILAADRTKRPDILNKFHIYNKGWNIRDIHYWTSVLFTGLPGFIVAFAWLACGLVFLLVWCCWYCCCRPLKKEGNEHKQHSFWFPLLLLLLISLTAIAGCGLVYKGQREFCSELFHTVDYVMNQSSYTVDNLHNVSAISKEAATIDVYNVVLPADDIGKINQLSLQLNSSADQLEQKAQDNSHIVQAAIDTLRLVMIAVAGIMLLLVLLGLFSVACDVRSFVTLLVCIGWLLVTGTWILCSVFILLNNAMGDTCLAMEEWVNNPKAHTNLDSILPCVDQQTANQTLYKSKDLTNSVVTVVNQAITFVINNNLQPGAPFYFNQSGPPLPYLCSPYGPAPTFTKQVCSSHEVDFETAPERWLQYLCTSANDTCTSTGRLTLEAYHKLIEAVSVGNGLHVNVPFLISVENCNFVRATFQQIITDHCPQHEKYTRWVWIGLILVSGGSMLAILFWIICSIKCPQFMQYGRVEDKHFFSFLWGRTHSQLSHASTAA